MQRIDAHQHYWRALDVAEITETVAVVVGWIDLQSPTAAQSIAAFARNLKGRGLRPVLQDLPDDDWVSRPRVEQAIAALAACEDDCQRVFAEFANQDILGGNACRLYGIGSSRSDAN
jgi:predicted TIM-barrel fold metal-dependent hydrolase